LSGGYFVVDRLVAGYEWGAPVVRGASLTAERGEIVVVLGPNGAGKSSLIKAVAGLIPVEAGSVRLDGVELIGTPTHLLVRRGLGYVPQAENVFTLMSVEDNLRLAGGMLPKRDAAARISEMFSFFPDLAHRHRTAAGNLSGGQRQMLALARALMMRPGVLMLDEPSAGLAPKLVEVVFAHLAAIRDTGVAIVLVEQNARAALGISDRAYVLVEGRNGHEGKAADLWGDPVVAELYLGRPPQGPNRQ
jgi:branched-chain amino acid transport system ATP-binding protein